TGGGNGIGRGVVLRLAQTGADVVVADINPSNAEKVAEEVHAVGRKAIVVKTDVGNASEINAMVDRALREFGKIDILVNNAGQLAPLGMPFTNNTPEDWDKAFAINTRSVFLTSKAVAPHLIERKAGRIINIASIAGPGASLTMPPYSVAKAGV